MVAGKLLLAGSAAVCFSVLTACSSPASLAPVVLDARSETTRLLNLVNDVRAKGAVCAGETMPPVGRLQPDSRLASAAQEHSDDMASRNYFSHTSPEGDTSAQRVSSQGYRWSVVGENLAAGQTSADQVVNDWLASPGHCRNLMRAEYTTTGLGLAGGSASDEYGTYWTQVYAKPGN